MLNATIKHIGKNISVLFEYEYQPAEPDVNFAECASIENVTHNGNDITCDIGKINIMKLESIALQHYMDLQEQFLAILDDHEYNQQRENNE